MKKGRVILIFAGLILICFICIISINIFHQPEDIIEIIKEEIKEENESHSNDEGDTDMGKSETDNLEMHENGREEESMEATSEEDSVNSKEKFHVTVRDNIGDPPYGEKNGEGYIVSDPNAILIDDYRPQKNLTVDEAGHYCMMVFFDLCRDPSKIDLYHEVILEESREKFNAIEWKFDNPEEFYDWGVSNVNIEGDDRYCIDIGIDSQYGWWELNLEEEIEGKWSYANFIYYIKDTGEIIIKKNYLFSSYY